MFTTRAFSGSEVVAYTNCGLNTADFAATGILFLQNCSRPRLGLQLHVPAFKTLLQMQQSMAAATARAATTTTIEEAALGHDSRIYCNGSC